MSISINEIKSADWSFKVSDFGEVVEGYDDINQSINTILKTPKGTDVFRPFFGAEITKYSDQPINQAGPEMVREILEALQIWETRIEVTSVNYTVDISAINFEIRWILVENRQAGVANVAIQTAPTAVIELSLPPTPLNLSASLLGLSSVSLNWNYELSPIGSVFQIFRSVDGGVFQFIGSAYNSFAFLDSNLLGGNYEYKVRSAKGTEFGEFSNIAGADVLGFFEFTTTHNNSNQNYNPTILGANITWIFGTDTVTGDSPNYSGAYLDGTLKTVRILSTNFSSVELIDFTAFPISDTSLNFSLFDGEKVGTSVISLDANTETTVLGFIGVWSGINFFSTNPVNYDFSEITGFSGGFNLASARSFIQPNTEISVTTFRNTGLYLDASLQISNILILNRFSFIATSALINIVFNPAPQIINSIEFQLFGASGLVSLDISQFTVNTQLTMQNSGNGGGFIVGGGAFTRLSFFNNGFKSYNFGNGNIGDHTSACDFRNSGLISSEIDALYVELDRISTVLTVAGTCEINTGGNGAPTVASQAARDSLAITKKYTVIL